MRNNLNNYENTGSCCSVADLSVDVFQERLIGVWFSYFDPFQTFYPYEMKLIHSNSEHD